ncbi:MAG: nucleotide exchange factor GrpE [Chitinophagaceae bacterium]|nr:nucleotide exchange factor GrpE [Chitinophagaceae bacterium]
MSQANQDIVNDTELTPDLNSDENMSGNSHMNDEMTSEDELGKLQNEIGEWKDKYTRLLAEFENYKKRSRQEMTDVIKTAGKDIVLSLLEVVDDSERAEKQMDSASDIQALKDGMQLVFNKLKHVLQQKGLKSFDSIHTEFDVERHEAVTEIPAPHKDLEGKVLDELQKGYLMNDKLIRYAKVVVGKVSEA